MFGFLQRKAHSYAEIKTIINQFTLLKKNIGLWVPFMAAYSLEESLLTRTAGLHTEAEGEYEEGEAGQGEGEVADSGTDHVYNPQSVSALRSCSPQ